MVLELLQPDDFHLHLRDGESLAAVAHDTAKRFGRALIMPNLKPPITHLALAVAYRERILSATREFPEFEPLMSLYLTDATSTKDIEAAADSSVVRAVKLYPAGATTHSDAGVTRLEGRYSVLETMAKRGLPLLIHGEVTDSHVDVFDREHVFIETQLAPLLKSVPGLKVVLEHITTREAVHFVMEGPTTLAATITAHHLLLNRNALFQGGVQPHHYCLPILKREEDRLALMQAAGSGNRKFFLGTDSAPHSTSAKEAACGCAGIYTAHAGIELYAEAFEAMGKLHRLEAFASHFGADFYGLPRNQKTVRLEKKAWKVAEKLPFGKESLRPFRAGSSVAWQFVS
jgi:dihydroorotase